MRHVLYNGSVSPNFRAATKLFCFFVVPDSVIGTSITEFRVETKKKVKKFLLEIDRYNFTQFKTSACSEDQHTGIDRNALSSQARCAWRALHSLMLQPHRKMVRWIRSLEFNPSRIGRE
jgi:hypothetical protein